MSEIVKIETRGTAYVLAPTSDAVEAQEVSISTWVGIHKHFYMGTNFRLTLHNAGRRDDKCTTHTLLLMCI